MLKIFDHPGPIHSTTRIKPDPPTSAHPSGPDHHRPGPHLLLQHTMVFGEWLYLLQGRARTGRAEFEASEVGCHPALFCHRFSPCLTLKRRTLHTFELGFARASLNDDRIVRGLNPRSAAAKAGVREGDSIVDVRTYRSASMPKLESITLELNRKGVPIRIAYRPRGRVIEGYRWTRDMAIHGPSCEF
ncbi:MAG: hypothetical protein U1F35_15955 [Steroidobacteraceae bacterium]